MSAHSKELNRLTQKGPSGGNNVRFETTPTVHILEVIASYTYAPIIDYLACIPVAIYHSHGCSYTSIHNACMRLHDIHLVGP